MILHPIIDLLKRIVVALPDYGGGTSITDGIVVNSRDANGYVTEINYYNSTGIIAPYELGGNQTTNRGFQNLEKVTVKSDITQIGDHAFYQDTKLSEIVFEGTATTVLSGAFQGCNTLINIDFPFENVGQSVFQAVPLVTAKLPLLKTSTGNNGAFRACTSLTSLELGSVGHGITSVNNICGGCTQEGFTITIYTTGSYADTAVTNIRQGATKATIIVKASEETTYNGTTYNAGDTILTSEVTP